ncbi:4-hydroxy-2-oxoheptanedioate aldolase [Novosphingobium chloroacetimidivorans]|uniref:4-hydroxy-2-oxoheptanedioate aldolase n=1 Tax=Novosphingobium chloroacetimidivorans TaxID=1428314 RepID=A0A7W7KAS2_9SPHN|nr:HpcH/HpaI aldolase/citrate lyase family protein [Novosphingobium chloroacetimidivorans]MBB4858648.1 4-hydroxy-2-oxoheptanedioate aldolase [Novosphingobium chloroacetimidivorans]
MTPFRERLAQGRSLIGLWQALANPYTAEICAGAGYDWLLIDGEHAPNTLQTLVAQLQAVAPYPVEPIARVPVGDPAIIKQYLDLGFRTLLVPMMESAAQAERTVAACRFPPLGIRGVASATSRASGFGRDLDYLRHAHENVTLIVQIESGAGLEAIDAIAATPGVDALFIGPADLAASLGHLGDPRHPAVQSAVSLALQRIAAAGKPAGIFALSPEDARTRIAAGIGFVSVGTDIGLLANGAKALRETVLH